MLLTGFQRDALLCIGQNGPLKGLAIRDGLENRFPYKNVNHGRLYPNLDDLVDMGLVDKSEFDKRTNHYELTERGETYLRERLEEHRLALND